MTNFTAYAQRTLADQAQYPQSGAIEIAGMARVSVEEAIVVLSTPGNLRKIVEATGVDLAVARRIQTASLTWHCARAL